MVDIPSNFVYIFPAVYGLVVGIVELMFVHADEQGLGWIGHGLHALPWCIIFSYASLNVPFLMSLIPFAVPFWVGMIVIPLILAAITAFKVKTAAALAKGGSVGEKMIHAIIIGVLVAVGPLVLWALTMIPGIPGILLQ